MASYLTERREKVLKMTLQGNSKNHIAAVLGVAPRTITNDRKVIRMALRPHIDIDSLEALLWQLLRKSELLQRKTSRMYYQSSNSWVKLKAINMEMTQTREAVALLRTLGFIATESEKGFLEQKKR